MIRRLGRAATVLMCLGAASRAAAQFAYAVDAGGIGLSTDQAVTEYGAAVSPVVRFELPSASLLARSNLEAFDVGGWVWQGLLSASIVTPPTRAVQGEFLTTVNGVSYAHSGSMFALSEGRVHLLGARADAWLGAGAGAVQNAPTYSGVFVTDAGGSWRAGGFSLSASLTRSEFRTRDAIAPFDSGSPPTALASAFGLAYRGRVITDAVAQFHYQRGALELDATTGARLRSVSDQAQQWGSVGGAYWLTATTAITARVGSAPRDPLRGYPGMHFLTAGIRLAMASPAPPAPVRPRRLARALKVRTDSADARTIRIEAAGVSRVELRGDLTLWNAEELSSVAAGVWELHVRVPAGTYRLSVRFDGGEWETPPGLAAQQDEFGGVVGVIVIQ